MCGGPPANITSPVGAIRDIESSDSQQMLEANEHLEIMFIASSLDSDVCMVTIV